MREEADRVERIEDEGRRKGVRAKQRGGSSQPASQAGARRGAYSIQRFSGLNGRRAPQTGLSRGRLLGLCWVEKALPGWLAPGCLSQSGSSKHASTLDLQLKSGPDTGSGRVRTHPKYLVATPAPITALQRYGAGGSGRRG